MTAEPLDTTGAILDFEAGIDPQLAEILEAYLLALEAGSPPAREAFLAQHPEHADALARYLPWVELLYQAKPREAESAANPPMPSELGDFRILHELGRGGMGIVYEAEQISLKRRVALKVLPFASMLDERQLARFKNEALAAAQLHHPHIVPVFAVGCERGLHFYVMQLIEGHTLEQWIQDLQARSTNQAVTDSTVRLIPARTSDKTARIKKSGGKLSEENSAAAAVRFRKYARWFVQAAEALDQAHNQGIVHRDVKPSNMMISREGDLWVTDFGLARSQRDASMTVSGELLGTLRYMSPEQLRSKSGIVDHRTDIYSLGLTLYELILERPAFEGQSQHELIHHIENHELSSLTKFDPRVPRDLDSIVLKATSKSADARYASSREMADDLRRFLAGQPTLARPATFRDQCEKWVRRHTRLVASIGFGLSFVLICALFAAVSVWQAQGETQQALGLASDNYLRAEQNLQDARQAVDNLFTGVATDLAEVPGAENVRYQLLEQALAYYRKFALQAAANPAVRAEVAAAHYRCGQISEQLGDDEAAQRAYHEAKAIWTALVTQEAKSEHLQSLSLCENNLGLVVLRGGRAEEAATHLRAATELQRQATTHRQDDPAAKSALALSYANLGMVLGQLGDTHEARQYLERALDLQTSIASPSVRVRGELATIYNQLGYLRSMSSAAEAEAAYRQAEGAFASLTKDEPTVLRWQAELARTLNNLAAIAASAARFEDAEGQYIRAAQLQQQLAQRAPAIVAYRRDLAVTQNNLGFLLSQRQQHARAIEQFENARTHLAELARLHEKSPEYASRMGAVCNNLGLALEGQQALDRAQAAYGEAIEWQEKALALSPNWQQAQTYLAAHSANLQRVRKALTPNASPEPTNRPEQVRVSDEVANPAIPHVPVRNENIQE